MSNKNQFKDTLNLPKTSFPMKANLAENEPKSLKRWQASDLYHQIIEKNNPNSEFIFHDGPPYANGNIHIGHLLNKTLKDIVVRSQNMLGRRCSFRPGWDCHGLPIEHRVMAELSKEKAEKLKNLNEDTRRIAIRNECKRYAEKFIKIQSEQMQRLLTLGEYKTPYLTMNPDFESNVLDIFADLVAEGIVYRQLKPVHWSIANQTALAEAELEYEDKVDTAIFLNFDCLDSGAMQNKFNIPTDKALSLLVWTTTPWTIPANLAIAIHQDHEYSIVDLGMTHNYIIATERIDSIVDTCHLTTVTALATLKGSDLLDIQYQHPFCDRQGKIIHGSFVTLDDGSGLVHIAPGHGTDDYIAGNAHQLDVYCPVLADGSYDDTVPDWLIGRNIWEANAAIVDQLQKNNNLLYSYEFSHSYPHDWRSKTPVIFRSTEQWFVSVDKALNSSTQSIRDLALDDIENKIQFIPEWGQSRLRGMIESRPDWCISRQRAWGLPIPAFETETGDILLTQASVRAIAKVIEEEGSDAWFKNSPEDLLKYYQADQDPDFHTPLSLDKLKKCYDIFDVWFESGSSWQAVMNLKKENKQIDLYLEGSDQHRGWFQLSLLLGLGSQKQAPFKQILTHGFIVDKDGRKMSKSLGNTIDVDILLKKYGAEVARWWVSSLSFENDIKVDLSFFDVAGDAYRKIRNTLRFLLSNLFDFDITPLTENNIATFTATLAPESTEAYILSQCQRVTTEAKLAYETFQFKDLHFLLYHFCNQDLSSFYCMLVKDRLYCDKADSPRRRRAQKSMQIMLDQLCRLLAPILPHTAEEAFSNCYGEAAPSVHLQSFLNIETNCSNDWTYVMDCRQQVLKALEEAKSTGIDNTLDCGIQLSDTEGKLAPFLPDLADIFGVSEVTLVAEAHILKVENRQDMPRCERSWKRDHTVKERKNGAMLSDRDADAIGV